jgi:imidazolonepropionase-like amidohydrolase
MLRNLRGSVLLFAVLAVCWSNIFAQSSQHIAIHAGHVLDVTTGKILADQLLVIEDGKVVSVGPAAGAKAPADATRIELPNATILPGLIDAHTHLTMNPEFGYETLAISTPR